ncbi:hypothetical protein J8F10_09165 [Gemmata sp. G18]|uniref:Adenine methyltransferase n=1 Tax=Gemmata palustris TaxID=2822762 RepID=A0ABS5BNZ2_9BACT|nr:DNA N-6-adenine-methyltransferase [Gemmata palustris]MBP3955450.1 hypothetical protein [Gemmata palustris]
MTHGFNHVISESSKDEWLTPPHIIRALGQFDLDPCAPVNRPWEMASRHYTVDDDGLRQPWEGRVWCNPPYGAETFKWMNRCAEHGNAIGLIFARTETKGFHAEIWAKADAVFFFKGRLAFHHVDGTKAASANAPSCLIAYGQNNVAAIASSGLAGVLVKPIRATEDAASGCALSA